MDDGDLVRSVQIRPVMACEDNHIKKKSLGQNFLNNPNVIERISHSMDVSDQLVVEVGPGQWALTKEILKQKPKQLHVIELDRDLIPYLKEEFGTNITVHHADVLTTDVISTEDWIEILQVQEWKEDTHGNYVVFGNIPYYITSPIITHFLYEVSSRPEKMVLMMQKEVAEKILARDGKESVLSLSVKLMCTHVKKVCDVGRWNFSPPPKVDSAVLLFELRNDASREFGKQVLWLIHAGFSQKRKKLINNLRQQVGSTLPWEWVFADLSLNIDIRAEDVELSVWERMMKKISK